MTKLEIKSILIYPKRKHDVPAEDFRKVVEELRPLGLPLYTTSETNAGYDVKYLPPEEAFAKCEAAVVLGGDGTILGAARFSWKTGTALLGVNFGTLGYLSELEIAECSLLGQMKNGKIEDRMLLDAEVYDPNGKLIGKGLALNEVSICRKAPGTIIRMSVKCDGHPVGDFRADGMLLSTPTGSTAYNLSAGGPIIDPKMDAICFCPLAPHTLTLMRPVLFSPDVTIEVEITKGNAAAACDSTMLDLPDGYCKILVRKSGHTVKLLKLKDDGFYQVLLKKMK